MQERQSSKPVFPSEAIAAKYGYRVVRDVEQPSQCEAKNLRLPTPFMNIDWGTQVDHHALLTRAWLEVDCGLVDAKSILDQSEEIPPILRGTPILFTGTLVRYQDSDLYMGYLDWRFRRWGLYFHWHCRLM